MLSLTPIRNTSQTLPALKTTNMSGDKTQPYWSLTPTHCSKVCMEPILFILNLRLTSVLCHSLVPGDWGMCFCNWNTPCSPLFKNRELCQSKSTAWDLQKKSLTTQPQACPGPSTSQAKSHSPLKPCNY